MPFDRGHCQIPYPSPGPKGWGFQLTGALYSKEKTPDPRLQNSQRRYRHIRYARLKGCLMRQLIANIYLFTNIVFVI